MIREVLEGGGGIWEVLERWGGGGSQQVKSFIPFCSQFSGLSNWLQC